MEKQRRAFGKRKAAAVIMAMALAAAGLAGCGGGKGSGSSLSSQAREGVVTDDRISVGGMESGYNLSLSTMQLAGDRIYSSGYYYSEQTGEAGSILCSFRQDGTDYRNIPGDAEGCQAIFFKEDGSRFAVIAEYPEGDGEAEEPVLYDTETEEASEGETSAARDKADPGYAGIGEPAMYLVSADPAGRELWRTRITSWTAEEGEEDYFYIYAMGFVDGQGICLAADGSLGLFDQTDGSFIRSIQIPEAYDCGLSRRSDGSLMVRAYTETGYKIYTLDAGTGELSDPVELPEEIVRKYQILAGTSTDLLLYDDKGLYTMNFGDQEPAMKVSFANSDMDILGVTNAMEMEDGSFVALCYDNGGSTTLHILTPVDPEDVKDKKILTLGCYYLDSDVRSAVVEFNRASDEYRIQIRDYSSYDNYDSENEEDWTAGSTQLNSDIISGNLPDLLVLDSSMPIQSYVQKGVFEDLNPYLEKDEDLDREDYFTNIFDAFNPDGKFCVLMPSFSIHACTARTSDVGEDGAISPSELTKLAGERGIAAQNIFGLDARDSILWNMLELNGASYIDMDRGTCSFDSPEFTEFLAFTREFPGEFPENTADDFWENYDLLWRDGKALVRNSYISDFRSFREDRSVYYDTDRITYMGFPAADPVGPAADASLQLAMSASAADKEACWQFLRRFLTEEYQDAVGYQFPVRRSSFEKMAEKAMQKPSYVDENGKTVEYDETYYVNEGMEIVIDPLTEEELTRIRALVESLDHCSYRDTSVSAIIEEETAAYYAGEKTAEEAADIIQSRVQIYINENR